MGIWFDETVSTGSGLGRLLLTGPSQDSCMFRGSPGKTILGGFELPSIRGEIGVGQLNTTIEDGIITESWSDTAVLEISEFGASYKLNGNTTSLDVTESPAGSDAYLLTKHGHLLGIVWMVSNVIT